MTVSTEYFDYVFEAREEVADELEKSTRKLARLERKEDRLERLIANRPTDKRLARLDRVTGLVDTFETEVDLLTEELADLNDVELPKDEVTFALWCPREDITGLQVTITDSPYDDSFVGGQNSSLYITGTTGKAIGGTKSFGSRIGLIGDDFEDGTDTFAIGGMDWEHKLSGVYKDVEASLLQGWTPKDGGFGPERTFNTAIFTEGVLQVDDCAVV